MLARSRDLGMLGPGAVEGHVDHALAQGAALWDATGGGLGPDARFLDLGSGGGVPGLVLASAHAVGHWVLLDANTRRAAFLETARADLGLQERVTVLTGRAEVFGHQAAHRQAFAAATARGFGPPAVVAECGAPFLVKGGMLVVSEPPAVDEREPVRWPEAGLAAVGLELVRVRPGPPSFAVLRQAMPCPARFPRRTGVPTRRPLW